jgi:hypothetical protein
VLGHQDLRPPGSRHSSQRGIEKWCVLMSVQQVNRLLSKAIPESTDCLPVDPGLSSKHHHRSATLQQLFPKLPKPIQADDLEVESLFEPIDDLGH